MHPCFNNSGSSFLAEVNVDGTRSSAVKVWSYMTPIVEYGTGMANLKPHVYFHRSFQDVMRLGFEAGLVVTGFEERSFSGEVEERSDLLKWGPAYSEIPPVVVIRMERAAG
jgi:hypothetical protein